MSPWRDMLYVEQTPKVSTEKRMEESFKMILKQIWENNILATELFQGQLIKQCQSCHWEVHSKTLEIWCQMVTFDPNYCFSSSSPLTPLTSHDPCTLAIPPSPSSFLHRTFTSNSSPFSLPPHASFCRSQCLLILRRPCAQTEGRAMKDLWMWPLWASLHPPAPLPPHAPIIISSLLCAGFPPNPAPSPNPHVPAACTPSFMTSTASPPISLPSPRLLRSYQPGHANRRRPRWIRKCPSLPIQRWPSAMTSQRRPEATGSLRPTAAMRAARRAGVQAWGRWRGSTALRSTAQAPRRLAPALTPGWTTHNVTLLRRAPRPTPAPIAQPSPPPLASCRVPIVCRSTARTPLRPCCPPPDIRKRWVRPASLWTPLTDRRASTRAWGWEV